MKQSVYGALVLVCASMAGVVHKGYLEVSVEVAILFAASFLIFAIGLTND